MQKLFPFGEGFNAPVKGQVLGPDEPFDPDPAKLLSELVLMETLRTGLTVRKESWNDRATDVLGLTIRYRTESKTDSAQRARRRFAVLRQIPGDVKTHRAIVPTERLQVAW